MFVIVEFTNYHRFMVIQQLLNVNMMSSGLSRSISLMAIKKSSLVPSIYPVTGCNTVMIKRCFGQRMAFLPNVSDRKKLLFISLGCFSAAAIGGKVYDGWKREKTQRELIKSQIQWDSQKREFITSSVDLKSEGTVSGASVPLDKIQGMEVTKRIAGVVNLPNIKLTLFQYQSCPFCCKVRAFLDFYGLPYDVIEVNPVLRQQLKIFEYKKVPTLIVSKKKSRGASNDTTGEESSQRDVDPKEDRVIDEAIQLKDSTLIISILSSYFFCNPDLQDNLNQISNMYPTLSFASLDEQKAVSQVVNKYFLMKGDHMSPAEYKVMVKKLSEERKWREWVDDVLVHTLSPNVYRTFGEAIDTFKYFSFTGDWDRIFKEWEKQMVIYVGASAMYMIGKRLKKKHRLKPDVRESLYDAVRHWLKNIPKGQIFMGGDKLNLADLSVYGVLSSIEGCEAFSDLMVNVPQVTKWYMAVKKDVYEKNGSKEIIPILKSLK